jgi:hypothetical protein
VTDVWPLVVRLAALPSPDADRVGTELGARFTGAGGNPHWAFHRAAPAAGPFAAAELRIERAGPRRLLVLESPRSSASPVDLGLAGRTDVRLDVNPNIPPEGTVAYTVAVNGVSVAFQFTARSHRLRALSLHWP